MKLYIAADHAGFQLKDKLRITELRNYGIVEDLTPDYIKGDDYPGVARKLAKKVVQRTTYNVQRIAGVLICGSGVGVCIAANKVKGIRAAVGHSVEEVKLAREHNDINVLCLSGWETKPAEAVKMIEVFLKTKASKAERHVRRRKGLD